MAAEFIDDGDERPLTVVEQREATRVPGDYLEKAAEVSEAAPDLPGTPPDVVPVLRLGRGAELYYLPVAEEAKRLAAQVRAAMVRKKSFAAGTARFIVAKWLKPYVDELKRILTRAPHEESQFPISTKNLSRDVTDRHES